MRGASYRSGFTNKMNSKVFDLYDLATIALDIEKRRSMVKLCESCKCRVSTELYIVKILIYGIYHVCEPCKQELMKIADKKNTAFFSK